MSRQEAVTEYERALKLAFLVNAILFAVFNAVIWNFVGLVADLVVAATVVIYFIRTRKGRKSESKEETHGTD